MFAVEEAHPLLCRKLYHCVWRWHTDDELSTPVMKKVKSICVWRNIVCAQIFIRQGRLNSSEASRAHWLRVGRRGNGKTFRSCEEDQRKFSLCNVNRLRCAARCCCSPCCCVAAMCCGLPPKGGLSFFSLFCSKTTTSCPSRPSLPCHARTRPEPASPSCRLAATRAPNRT